MQMQSTGSAGSGGSMQMQSCHKGQSSAQSADPTSKPLKEDVAKSNKVIDVYDQKDKSSVQSKKAKGDLELAANPAESAAGAGILVDLSV